VHGDFQHRNVVRLAIRPAGRVGSWVAAVLDRLPGPLRALGARYLPEWFLPPNVVLKITKDRWDEEFDNEKKMYATMAALQGTRIPVCYGQAKVYPSERRALVLSDVGGLPLYHKDLALVPHVDLRRMMTEALRDLAAYGFQYADLRLSNFHLVGDRIVVLDLEQVCDLNGPAEYTVELSSRAIATQYARYKGRPVRGFGVTPPTKFRSRAEELWSTPSPPSPPSPPEPIPPCGPSGESPVAPNSSGWTFGFRWRGRAGRT